MTARDRVPGVAVDDLEAVMAQGWWPLEHEWLGGWLLRASAGFTGRGNSALPLGDPGCELPAALEKAEEFYRSRGLPPRFAVPAAVVGDVDSGPLAKALADRGYRVATPTAVMTAESATVAGLAGARADEVALLEEPDEGWLQLYRYRGQRLPPEASRLLLSAPYQRFASVVADGATVAVGRLAIAHEWGGITAMHVARSHRRQGLGWAVLAALARHAAGRGARRLYLQVAADNAPARRLYAEAGFEDHHGYHYRVLERTAADLARSDRGEAEGRTERHVTGPTAG